MRFKSVLAMKLEIAASQKLHMHGLLLQVSACCLCMHAVDMENKLCLHADVQPPAPEVLVSQHNMSTSISALILWNVSWQRVYCMNSWQPHDPALYWSVASQSSSMLFWLKLFCRDICPNHWPLCRIRWGLHCYSATACSMMTHD